MNDAESDNPDPDQKRVHFEYGDGGVPVFVGIIWVVFIVCYLVVMAAVALPDFIAWMSA